MLFKWDKEQVDRQPTQYLMTIISINLSFIGDIFTGLGGKGNINQGIFKDLF